MLRQATVLSGLADQTGEDAELHFVLVDSAGITTLNEVHLGHEGATDVISFDLTEEIPIPGETQVAGEIYVCVDVAVQMGEELGTGAAYELMLYCVHGVLHLVGLDDHEAEDRKRMRAAEARIMEELGEIGDLQSIL